MVSLKNRVNDLEAPKRYGGSKDYDSMAHISRDWPNLSAEEKTNLCLEYDIELADYTTNSITCCIDTDTVSGLVQPPLKVFTD